MEGTVSEVQMGVKVSKFPVDRYRASKNKRDRITILSPNPIVTKTMYLPKVGRFYALDEFVPQGVDTKVHYNFLIVVWNTDLKGNVVGPEWELKILSIGDEQYQNLCDKHELNGPLANFMLLVSCTDEKYQKLTYEMAGDTPMKTDKALAQAVKLKYAEFKPYITEVAGQRLTYAQVCEKAEIEVKKPGDQAPAKSQHLSNPSAAISNGNNLQIEEANVVEELTFDQPAVPVESIKAPIEVKKPVAKKEATSELPKQEASDDFVMDAGDNLFE